VPKPDKLRSTVRKADANLNNTAASRTSIVNKIKLAHQDRNQLYRPTIDHDHSIVEHTFDCRCNRFRHGVDAQFDRFLCPKDWQNHLAETAFATR